jgi:hypothetical protein
VILGGRKDKRSLSVRQNDKTDLAAGEETFQHNVRAGLPHKITGQHGVCGLAGFGGVFGDHHALAGG